MNDSSLYVFQIWQICLISFAGIIIFSYLGYYAGVRSRRKKESDVSDIGSRRTGLVTLLALILGFTFGMSGGRYMDYKKAIVDEINSISTAGSYSDLYPEPYRTEFRKYFSDYIQARIGFYDAGTDLEKVNESKIKSTEAGKRLWDLASKMFRNPEFISPSRLMAPSINEMLDAGTSRETSLMSKVPYEIPTMIVLITFIVVYLAGYDSVRFGKRQTMFLIMFAFIITLVIYTILDLDRPDSGLIKPTAEQGAMIELSKSFNDGK